MTDGNDIKYKDEIILKVVHATHYQDDVRYGTYRSIECPPMSFISLSQTFVRSTGEWDKFEWDSTLGNQYQLFKYLSKFRYLGIENVSREFLMEGFHINGQFVENSTKENKAEEFLLPVVEIVNSIFGLVPYLLLTIIF